MTIEKNKSMAYTLLNEPLTFFGGVLFFLMIYSPNYNVAFKIILIIILLTSITLSRITFDKLNVTGSVLIWYLIFIFHGIFFTLLGYFNRNNSYYVLRTTTYNIIWPAFYLVFTIGLYKKTTILFLIKIIVIANLLVSLYIIGSALTLLGILPHLRFFSFSMSELQFDFGAGLAKVNAPAVITMMFTIPFISSLTLVTDKEAFGFKKWFFYLSVLISIVAVICTVRRALILNIFLGILFTVIFSWWAIASTRRVIGRNTLRILLSGIIILAIVLFAVEKSGLIDLTLVFQKLLSAFQSKQDASDVSVSIRYDQFDLLIKSWLQKPLFGHGHGAVSDFIIRSYKTPWIYELTYIALLFQTGIIGLLVYLGLLSWPIYKGLGLLKKGNTQTALMIIPLLVGCICFLIANATNPYLQSYDCMWTLFFPVAVVNYYLKGYND